MLYLKQESHSRLVIQRFLFDCQSKSYISKHAYISWPVPCLLNHVQSVAGDLQSISKEMSKIIKAKQDEPELQQRETSGYDF